MKKFIIAIIIAIIAVATWVTAETLHCPPNRTQCAQPYATNTLLSAVTGTSTGSAVNLGESATTHVITYKLAGASPNSAVMTPYCSNDGTNYDTLTAETVTHTVNPHIVIYVNSPCQYLKIGYATVDASTNVTATVRSIQQ